MPDIDWLALGSGLDPLLLPPETNSSGTRLPPEEDKGGAPYVASGCGLGVEVAGVAIGGMCWLGGVAES